MSQSPANKNDPFGRRTFIGGGLAVLGAGALAANKWGHLLPSANGATVLPPHVKNSHLVATHADFAGDHRLWQSDQPGFVRILAMDTGEQRTIKTPVSAHVFNQHPVMPNILLGATKHAKGAVVVDVKTQDVLAHLISPDHTQFYGHACFNRAGTRAYLSAHQISPDKGLICVYDTGSWKLIDTVWSGGVLPHDMYLTTFDEILIVNERYQMGGDQSEVCVLTPPDMKIRLSYRAPIVSHAVELGSYVVLSGHVADVPTSFCVLDLESGKVRNYLDAARASGFNPIGEGLSLCRFSKNEVAVSIPDSRQIMIWNLDTNKIDNLPTTESIHGMAEIEGQIYLNSIGANLYRMPADRRPTQLALAQEPFANGRHLRIFQI